MKIEKSSLPGLLIIKPKIFTDKRGYLLKYKDRRNDVINKTLNEIENVNYSLLDKCIKYFYPLMASAKQLCSNIGGSILLNIIGEVKEKIIIDFASKLDSINSDNKDELIDHQILVMIMVKIRQ